MAGLFAFSRRIAAVLTMALIITTGDIAAEMAMVDADNQAFVVVDSLMVPEVIDAGQMVTIEAQTASSAGAAVVIVHSAYGQMRFEMPVADGEGHLMLPAAVTQHAGIVTVVSGDQVETMEIRPGEVTTLVAPLVGPRTIVANGADETLAVVLPADRFGNQVADGTDTNILWEQPGGVGMTASPETIDGMAWALIPSGEIAGPTTVRATADADGTVRGSAVRIDEVPGTVRDITLTAIETTVLADGRSVVALYTDELTDAFGNTLADGTIAQFIFDGPSGRGALTGTVQNGAVHIELSAPTTPGRLTGYVEIHGIASNEVAIEYATAIASFDARVEFIGEEVVLRVDNALDPSGAFVADGTEVRWGDLRASLRRGSAEIWIPASFVDADARVEILGLTTQTEMSKP